MFLGLMRVALRVQLHVRTWVGRCMRAPMLREKTTMSFEALRDVKQPRGMSMADPSMLEDSSGASVFWQGRL